MQLLLPTTQTKRLAKIAELLGQLEGRWEPHPKQVQAIASILWEGKKELALEWGRRTGKGDTIVALFGLWGQLVPGSQSYYFAPKRKQSKRILWTSGKIEDICPGNWIDEMNSSELTVFWAGSPKSKETRKSTGWWIIDGADDYDATRGIEPKRGLLALDEVREMDKGLWQTVEPILARWDSPYIMATTPPDELEDADEPTEPNWIIKLFDAIKDRAEGCYIHATSFDNPYLSRRRLEQTKQDLIDKGEEDVWEREFMALRVPKKTGRRFAGLMDRTRHFRLFDDVMEEVDEQRDLLEWYAMTDPAGSSVWAWNFLAIHGITRKIYILDEMDERVQAKMTTSVQWGTAYKKIHELHSRFDDWNCHYDEAETWFANEMLNLYDVPFSPSEKTAKSKDEGFALIKDLLLSDLLVITDRCPHTWWELLNYENNKSRDHHIDILRYIFNVAGYTQRRDPTPPKPAKDPRITQRRVFTPASDMKQDKQKKDWTQGIV